MTWRKLAGYGPALVLTVTLLVLWELYVRAGQINPQVLPTPTAVVQALIDNWGIIYDHTLQTLLETVLGMAAATLLGLLLAILLDASSWLRRAIYPLLITSQTIPLIALAPLLLIWLGFGLEPKIIMVMLYCFFPIAVAVADGLAGAEPELINLLRSMRASRWPARTVNYALKSSQRCRYRGSSSCSGFVLSAGRSGRSSLFGKTC